MNELNELVKALRNCGNGIGLTERCRKCAYYDREWCSGDLCNDAADAIEKLQTEIEQLQSDLDAAYNH